MSLSSPLVVYVDVDETLVRNYGTARIPVLAVIAHVRALFEGGAERYCWSSGGAAYARASAQEAGLAECFVAFLPKPQLLLDDQHVRAWRRLLHVHPASCDAAATVETYRAALRPGRGEAERGGR
ncbi:hypothetical protein [Deinococcus maricopensis]|uniref:Integron gene cassette protein n=1 Tax=Deinococcus maricopensis (strain DSM 21211 / LMG 22137 / NRRL B-23946 / LB-34) TaxID=709986 RepID=E8U738_DEIML|nr:hypothetical protein [Deinococcus maricopensis]ADV66877.1 hypothetical protein Deima_1226 [Deinococcus maricopensis DSM 21211]